MNWRWGIWAGAFLVAVTAHAGLLSIVRMAPAESGPAEAREYDILLAPVGSLEAPLEEATAEPAAAEPAPPAPSPPTPPPPATVPATRSAKPAKPEPVPQAVLLPAPQAEGLAAEEDAALPAPPARRPGEKRAASSASSTDPAQQAGARFGIPAGVEKSQTEYSGLLQAWFMKHKRYPYQARSRRQEGVVRVWFRIDRQGRLLESRIEQGSGHRALDAATMELLKRASPFPPPPEELHATDLSFTVPVAYRLKQ